jgi:BirA family biotin operon repressor/biotin-[acetyl-CoA-carboxylase] ligase
MVFYPMKNSENYQFKNYLIHQFDEVESTNDLAFSLAENKQIFANQIIVANKQNKGRGRLNRNWESPKGNLYFSLVLQPQIAVEKISQISFVAVCALQIAVAKIFQQQNIVTEIQNKWPNDLLIDQKKVAGILLESKISNKICDFVILGIGVNINSNPPQTLFPSTNIGNFSCEISASKMLEFFLEEFENLYENWLNFGFKNIRNLWHKNAYNLNSKININLGKSKIEGLFQEIDKEGNIVIKNHNNETKKISFGDVS